MKKLIASPLRQKNSGSTSLLRNRFMKNLSKPTKKIV
jgi:hypothetical protein